MKENKIKTIYRKLLGIFENDNTVHILAMVLILMVAQYTLRTYEGNQVFCEKYFIFEAVFYLNKFLKQIKLSISLYMRASIFKLPSNISITNIFSPGFLKVRKKKTKSVMLLFIPYLYFNR